jgi:hypothetical protein
MTQPEFDEAIGLDSAETISRWESGARGIGRDADKLVRYAVYARLHKAVPAADYDLERIASMHIRQLAGGEELPTRVVVKQIIGAKRATTPFRAPRKLSWARRFRFRLGKPLVGAGAGSAPHGRSPDAIWARG